MSIKSKILEHLKEKYPNAVHKGELGRLAVNVWGCENENMGRRCRELVESGDIDVIYNSKREATYKFKPKETNCCYSYKQFGIHALDCFKKIQETNKEKVRGLF